MIVPPHVSGPYRPQLKCFHLYFSLKLFWTDLEVFSPWKISPLPCLVQLMERGRWKIFKNLYTSFWRFILLFYSPVFPKSDFLGEIIFRIPILEFLSFLFTLGFEIFQAKKKSKKNSHLIYLQFWLLSSILELHCISNQKVLSFIVNKNAKAQQQSQKRSLELLLNQ